MFKGGLVVINGEKFAKLILTNKNIPSEKWKVEEIPDAKGRKKYSYLDYKPNGLSKIYLSKDVYYGTSITSLQVAAHEVAHFLNNNKHKKRFRRLRLFNRWLYPLSVILGLFVSIYIWQNIHNGNLTMFFLFICSIIPLVISIIASREKFIDEKFADNASLKLILRYYPKNAKPLSRDYLKRVISLRRINIIAGIWLSILPGVIPLIFNLITASVKFFTYCY